MNGKLTFVHVPYPAMSDWTRRTLTCGVALQCSPSKERVTEYRLSELSARELRALTLVEAGVALGWIASRWPGLLPEAQRALPDVRTEAGDIEIERLRGIVPAAYHPRDARPNAPQAAAIAAVQRTRGDTLRCSFRRKASAS